MTPRQRSVLDWAIDCGPNHATDRPLTPRKKPDGPIGFARLTREQHFAVASKGGKKSQTSGNGHRFGKGDARIAGLASRRSEKSHKWTSETAKKANAKSIESKRLKRTNQTSEIVK